MEKMILIKYGELTTKKGNRNFFVKTLKNNLEAKIKKYDARYIEMIKENTLLINTKKKKKSHKYYFWNTFLSYDIYL